MKVLYVAEIVGKAGIYSLKKALPELRRSRGIDFVVACADGATGGAGLGRNHAAYIRKIGVDALTMGECVFYKKDLVENIGHLPYVLRPANLSASAPGWGSRVFQAGEGRKVAVAVLLGQSGFDRMHADSPFTLLPELLERLRRETPYVLVDFHASATAEKLSLFRFADGKCSAVIGSHGRVQTADEKVLPGGTAVICDAGRTGSIDSVGGCEPVSRVNEFLTGIPDWTKDAWARPELQGVLIDMADGGTASSIERIRIVCPEVQDVGNGKNPEDRGEDTNDSGR
ncbi:MAG: TIGR00282 family metallophosphoesterase [Treponemataceae bacterium]